MNPKSLHGQVAIGSFPFVRLLPAKAKQPTDAALEGLAILMQDPPDPANDSPDPEENLMVPAGYTYFSQFVDHDLTFDTTTSFNIVKGEEPADVRTPRLDLDNLYGGGPSSMPYMYQAGGVHLIAEDFDLPRASNNRAIIGDPRDDENSIICNLQMAFIRFHNFVVDALAAKNPQLGADALFKKARQEVTWTYQRIIVEDFLVRVVNPTTRKAFDAARKPNAQGRSGNDDAYALYKMNKRGGIPFEFAGAAYRFGHSMVRSGYRLSSTQEAPVQIFLPPPGGAGGPGSLSPHDSLVGFAPLPKDHKIDRWARFFPSPEAGRVVTPGEHNAAPDPDQPNPSRLQYAYRIDTALENPLAHLPSSVAAGEFRLAARNLLRGKQFELPTGQEVAKALGVSALEPEFLVVRKKTGDDKDGITEQFVPVPDEWIKETPLWFYILAEAQASVVSWAKPFGASFKEDVLLAQAAKNTTQLGEVGGRIVLEVFNGLLDSDPDSYRRSAAAVGWTPLIGTPTMWNLLSFTA